VNLSGLWGGLVVNVLGHFDIPARLHCFRRLWSNAVHGKFYVNTMKHLLLLLVSLSMASLSVTSWAAEPWRVASAQIDAVYPQVEALYLDLHRNPELSYHEEKTAAKIADQLRKLGYDVTTGVGGNGVVGVFKNGAGPWSCCARSSMPCRFRRNRSRLRQSRHHA